MKVCMKQFVNWSSLNEIIKLVKRVEAHSWLNSTSREIMEGKNAL